MKVKQLLQSLLFFVLPFALNCTGIPVFADSSGTAGIDMPVPGKIDTVITGKVIPAMPCSSNPAYTYALYVPAGDRQRIRPVIYFFDPHGDGTLPLSLYKSLADDYGFILVGSNNSRNGETWANVESIWTALFGDSKKRLPVNIHRIYTCGFSGGAKAAGYIALNHPEVAGVIAGGAVLPDGIAPANFHFSFTAIAGEGDMNMTDITAFSTLLDKTETRHRLLSFDGIHEWAPVGTMRIAFAGLELDAMRDKLIPVQETFIKTLTLNSRKKIETLLKQGNFIKAESECRLVAGMLHGLGPGENWFNQQEAAIQQNPEYKKQLEARQHLFATEQSLKEEYRNQLQLGDLTYWTNTIRELQVKAKTTNPERAMYQRLLAYLSLAFYSMSNQLIAQHRDQQARYFVDLYKTADAKNPEAWYFSAILQARAGNTHAVQEDLVKAIALHFADRARMRQQPEFRNLSLDLASLEKRMP